MSNRRKLRHLPPLPVQAWRQIGHTIPEPDGFRRAPATPNVVYGPAVLFTARHGDQTWQRVA